MPNAVVKVELSPSGMKAFVTVRVKPNGELKDSAVRLTTEDILTALSKAGVILGIDEEAVKAIIAEKKWGEKTAVAYGIEAINGEDGHVEYLFNTEQKPRPKELEDGRVDYREIGLVSFIKKDTPLAKRIPAQKGKPGMTVRGDTLPGRDGQEVFIKAGLNTYFPEGDDTELRAAISGSVSLRGGLVHVESSLLLKDGVNFGTGNVDFQGDVVVHGDIISGFTVKSGGKIEVTGVVEDAYLEAEGDVLIKGGFNGSGRGVIRAKGDVYLKFVENQSIEAEGSVNIGESSINAWITAGDRIELSTGCGTVIGGHLRAMNEIAVKVLGNAQCTTTTVEIVGDTTEFDNKHNSLTEQLDACKEQIEKVKRALSILQHQKVENPENDPRLLAKIQNYQDQLYELNKTEETLRAEITKLEVSRVGLGNIIVMRKVYPGAEIIIGGAELKVLDESNKATFERLGFEVVDVSDKSLASI